MSKETKQLERAETLLRDFRGIFEAVEEQQVRASGATRRELGYAVPITLHDFMAGLRRQVNLYFIDRALS